MPTKTNWALLASALLSFCLVTPTKAQVAPTVNPSPSVPTPESVLGHKPGDDFLPRQLRRISRILSQTRRQLEPHQNHQRRQDDARPRLGNRDYFFARKPRRSRQIQRHRTQTCRRPRAHRRRSAHAFKARQSDRPHRRRTALHRGRRRAAIDRAGLQTRLVPERSRSRCHPQQRDPDAVAHAKSRWPERSRCVVSPKRRHAV